MKYLVSLLFLLPINAFGQSIADYEQSMAKFQQFYNAGSGDSINALFGKSWDKMKASNPLWTNKENALDVAKFGTIKSFKFIGIDSLDPNRVYVFETIFSIVGAKTTSFTLDEDYNLGTFRLITSSEGIRELLLHYKSAEAKD